MIGEDGAFFRTPDCDPEVLVQWGSMGLPYEYALVNEIVENTVCTSGGSCVEGNEIGC